MPPSTPLPPNEDSWHRPTTAYRSAKPGTILRLRAAPGVNVADFGPCAAVYNILFATTDSLYEASWGVTTVFVPVGEDVSSSLLSYQPTYNTVNVDNTPSALVHRLKDHSWKHMVEVVSDALQRGWYVNFPDHEGPHAVFGNGVTTGHTTIDSIRAVLNAGFGIQNNPRIALWGFSGGAFASAWAAELQPHYAPEIVFHGAALGGLPASLECAADLSGTPYAALLAVVLLGTSKEYPDAYKHLLSQIQEEHKAEFLLPTEIFIDEAVKHFMNQDMWGRYFKNGRESIMGNPLIRKAFSLSRLGYRGIPSAALFIYKAIGDQNTPIEDTDELVKRWGDIGVNIYYERNTVGHHVQEAVNGRERAMEFLNSVLSDTYTHHGVTVKDVTIDVVGDTDNDSHDPIARIKASD